MKLAYSIDADKIIIDYTSAYCETAERLLRSKPFEHITHRYLEKLAAKGSPIYEELLKRVEPHDLMSVFRYAVTILRLLTTHSVKEISTFNRRFARLLEDRALIYDFVEGLYDFWRSYERYIVLSAPKTKLRTRDSIHHAQFIKANETLRQLILRTYRSVCENLIETPFRVYRQLPAGAHVGILNQNVKWDCPYAYRGLANIPFIRLALLEPPVIFYPKKNTRSGLFKEVSQNPLHDLDINPEEWFCYPAKIGKLLAFAYFHKRFMSHGTSLVNLFELAQFEDIYERRPDLVLLFGGPPLPFSQEMTLFHEDKVNNILAGYVVNDESVDYFGYMKKMLLTLHNVLMLERGLLPVHGAMVAIHLKNKAAANLVVIGDSGAGKSETLEAFRQLAQEYISDMAIIFDDMGSIDKNLIAFGTETGAFLRLDDLQAGYAFQQMDRSIFMNPHLINARVILPVSNYKRIVQGTPVQYLFYANNYEPVDELHPAVELFKNAEEALPVFSHGKRFAKGTTSEKGLVESYFANPFGAPQRRPKHEELAAKLMHNMFDHRVAVGQLRTQLGLAGQEHTGPQVAAKALFELITQRTQ
jgi:hypothetical protein